MGNETLRNAGKAKNDEFYTQIPDIANECSHYGLKFVINFQGKCRITSGCLRRFYKPGKGNYRFPWFVKMWVEGGLGMFANVVGARSETRAERNPKPPTGGVPSVAGARKQSAVAKLPGYAPLGLYANS
jgi:hypothetical protein